MPSVQPERVVQGQEPCGRSGRPLGVGGGIEGARPYHDRETGAPAVDADAAARGRQDHQVRVQATQVAAAHKRAERAGEVVRGGGHLPRRLYEDSVHRQRDASLLDPDRHNNGEEPPAHYAERGLQWPPRMADESAISYGVFGDPANAEAHARLYGTVLHAEQRTTTLTSQHFTAARVRSAGFELDMCLPATTPTPQPGNIIGGDVFLVASLPVPAKTPATRTRAR